MADDLCVEDESPDELRRSWRSGVPVLVIPSRLRRQKYTPAQQKHLRKWFWWGFWSAFDLTGRLTEVRRRRLEAESRALVELELSTQMTVDMDAVRAHQREETLTYNRRRKGNGDG